MSNEFMLPTDSRELIKALRTQGVILADDKDYPAEVSRAKQAKLRRLQQRVSALDEERRIIAKQLQAMGDDDMMDGEDEQASDGYDDDDLYQDGGDLDAVRDNSMNPSQPHLRPKGEPVESKASDPRSTRSAGPTSFGDGPGRSVVVRAMQLAEHNGLRWSVLRDREKAFKLALSEPKI